MRREPDLARRRRRLAVLATTTAPRIAPFQLMVRAAAGADPAAAAMLDEIDHQRLAGMTVIAAELALSAHLAVSEPECCDVLRSTTDGLLWHRLVVDRGWTGERFAEWLGVLWVRMLVRP